MSNNTVKAELCVQGKPKVFSFRLAFEQSIKTLEEQGDYLQAFGYSEQLIELIKQESTDSKQWHELMISRIQIATQQANKLIEEKKAKLGIKLLKRAMQLAEKIDFNGKTRNSLFNLVHNAMAYAYKDMGKLQLALTCLERTVRLAKESDATENLGITYLNLCAIYRILGLHDKCKFFAQEACVQIASDIYLLQHMKANDKLAMDYESTVKGKEALLGYAHYNTGLEEQVLGNEMRAFERFKEANALIENNPEASYEMKFNIQKALFALSKKIAKHKESKSRRETPKKLFLKTGLLIRSNSNQADIAGEVKLKRKESDDRNQLQNEDDGESLTNIINHKNASLHSENEIRGIYMGRRINRIMPKHTNDLAKTNPKALYASVTPKQQAIFSAKKSKDSFGNKREELKLEINKKYHHHHASEPVSPMNVEFVSKLHKNKINTNTNTNDDNNDNDNDNDNESSDEEIRQLRTLGVLGWSDKNDDLNHKLINSSSLRTCSQGQEITSRSPPIDKKCSTLETAEQINIKQESTPDAKGREKAKRSSTGRVESSKGKHTHTSIHKEKSELGKKQNIIEEPVKVILDKYDDSKKFQTLKIKSEGSKKSSNCGIVLGKVKINIFPKIQSNTTTNAKVIAKKDVILMKKEKKEIVERHYEEDNIKADAGARNLLTVCIDKKTTAVWSTNESPKRIQSDMEENKSAETAARKLIYQGLYKSSRHNYAPCTVKICLVQGTGLELILINNENRKILYQQQVTPNTEQIQASEIERVRSTWEDVLKLSKGDILEDCIQLMKSIIALPNEQPKAIYSDMASQVGSNSSSQKVIVVSSEEENKQAEVKTQPPAKRKQKEVEKETKSDSISKGKEKKKIVAETAKDIQPEAKNNNKETTEIAIQATDDAKKDKAEIKKEEIVEEPRESKEPKEPKESEELENREQESAVEEVVIRDGRRNELRDRNESEEHSEKNDEQIIKEEIKKEEKPKKDVEEKTEFKLIKNKEKRELSFQEAKVIQIQCWNRLYNAKEKFQLKRNKPAYLLYRTTISVPFVDDSPHEETSKNTRKNTYVTLKFVCNKKENRLDIFAFDHFVREECLLRFTITEIGQKETILLILPYLYVRQLPDSRRILDLIEGFPVELVKLIDYSKLKCESPKIKKEKEIEKEQEKSKDAHLFVDIVDQIEDCLKNDDLMQASSLLLSEPEKEQKENSVEEQRSVKEDARQPTAGEKNDDNRISNENENEKVKAVQEQGNEIVTEGVNNKKVDEEVFKSANEELKEELQVEKNSENDMPKEEFKVDDKKAYEVNNVSENKEAKAKAKEEIEVVNKPESEVPREESKVSNDKIDEPLTEESKEELKVEAKVQKIEIPNSEPVEEIKKDEAQKEETPQVQALKRRTRKQSMVQIILENVKPDVKNVAAKVLQRFYRAFGNKVTKLMVKRKKSLTDVCGDRLVSSKGLKIYDRYVVIKMFDSSEKRQLKIRLFDVESRKNHNFVVDNFSYSEISHEEYLETLRKILKTIDYHADEDKYYLGVDNELNKGNQDLGVRKLVDPNPETDEDTLEEQMNAGPRQEKIPEEKAVIEFSEGKEIKQAKEIYNGIRKLNSTFYRIRVLLTERSKADIVVGQEGKDTKEIVITMNYNWNDYFNANKKTNQENSLGRQLYSLVVLDKQGKLILDEPKFYETMQTHSMQLRNERLIKIQGRFRISVAKEFLKELLVKAKKKVALLTQFGLRIGKQYHLIKVLAYNDNKTSVFIRSDKSSKEVEISLPTYLPWIKDTDEIVKHFEKKRFLHDQLPSLIAFSSASHAIVLYPRKPKLVK